MTEAPGSPPPDAPAAPRTSQGLVLRNTLLLVGAQVVGAPLSIVVNAVMARHLGAEDFGYFYLAGTFASFGFLVVEWGQGGTLPAMVARDRSRAGVLLGSGLAWRAMMAVVVYVVLSLGCHALGYRADFQAALGLCVLGFCASSATAALQDTSRGFERTDIAAYALVGQQLLMGLLVVPALLLGGRLRGALGAQAAAYFIACVFIARALRGLHIGRLRVDRPTMKILVSEGSPFLALAIVLALQTNLDALLLSKLATAEAVGWHAAARKLAGVLVFPALSLANALYPTLARLYAEDFDAYCKSVRSALHTATVLVVPVALGCALYAEVGIRIFSRESFAPAEQNLRVLSLFIFLLYFSMTLGTALAAAGLQRAWAITQFACVFVSAIADPLLIPWFQRMTGNGGLGVCVATVTSEVLMVGVGFWLAPRGILDGTLFKGIGVSLAAGLAMGAVALLLHGVTPFVAGPIAVVAYVGALVLLGGLDKEQMQMIRGIVARKSRRA